ncbi:MAG: hypothetical protein OXG47_00765 [bacterium]|nr:hypothetical protein [bacterium]
MRDTTPAEDAQNAADALAVLVAGEALDACVSVRHVFDLVSERSPDDENRVVVEAAWSAL